MDYLEFLKSKIAIAKDYGFEVSDSDLPTILKPHQRDIVKWMVKGGRRAVFASFGLGKTLIQIEALNQIIKKEGGKALIVCPLGIRQEFKNDAENLLNIKIQYVKNKKEVESSECDILITNYERVRDGDINPNYFTATSLDEASILRGYGTKTYQSFLTLFKGVKYKFVATATPSPNKYKELIHYAGYLEIMDTGQALTRFFKRDSTQANNLTLYQHKEKEFWYWLSSWGMFILKPSDLGYDDKGYDLPKINYIYHEIPVNHNEAGLDEDGQVKMFRDSALGLKDASREKRDSIPNRVAKMKDIIDNDPDSNYIIWHHLESERNAINKVLGNGYDVYGSQDMEVREKRIMDFSYGKMKYLSTKPEIAGSGCNLQRYCHKAIFLGIDYKFNDFIQAVHRIMRFLQTNDVEIHIIYTESEREILKVTERKRSQHYKLVNNMIEIIKENGLNSKFTHEKLIRTMGIERKEVNGKLYKIANNDCVLEARKIDSDSIGLVLTSIPFSNHYEYTPSYNDFGHTKNNDEFWKQMDFLTPELKRILIPGRIAAIHVKDRILFSSMTDHSFPTVSPFHAETIFHFMKHDFGFLGMITIETDVVRENNQTYRLGWTEQCKDGSKMGVGSPEYLLLFRKQPSSIENAYSDIPVFKDKSLYTRGMWQIDARAKWNSSGDRLLTPEELSFLDLDKINRIFTNYFESNIYDYEDHVKCANDMDNYGRLPATFESLKLKSRGWNLWSDVNRMMTLNTSQSNKKLNMHICPLQFDIVDRTINRFSNKQDWVFDPFGGLMTVPYRAVKHGRKGRACELNPDYFRDGSVYMRAIESQVNMPSLFDIIEDANKETQLN
jgi:DNA modification methylase